jgi:ABC-type antimicrobial peptide transport system permease subunit
MALGADPNAIVGFVLRDAMTPVLLGLMAGLAVSVPFTGLIRSYLFQVAPSDPTALLASATLMVCAATAAAYLPARRATRIDPRVALRAQ